MQSSSCPTPPDRSDTLSRALGLETARDGRLGSLFNPNGTPRDILEPGHMLSIITWPKPEQLTWVAPSIRRAKS